MNKNPLKTGGLHRTDIFKDLTDAQWVQIVRNGQCERLQAKRTLFLQGDPAERFYMVNKGRLKLSKLNELGKEAIIRYIGAGEMAAAVAVLKGRDYPVTAEAVEETEVTGWDKPALLQLLRSHPEMAVNMLAVVLERLEEVQQRYLELCSESVEQRIARSLLRLMQRAGRRCANGVLIDLPLSRQNIADYSGTTLYTASRTLSSWEKKGWVQSGREKVVITDPHALVKFAEGS